MLSARRVLRPGHELAWAPEIGGFLKVKVGKTLNKMQKRFCLLRPFGVLCPLN
jgi:hypothetical protein